MGDVNCSICLNQDHVLVKDPDGTLTYHFSCSKGIQEKDCSPGVYFEEETEE